MELKAREEFLIQYGYVNYYASSIAQKQLNLEWYRRLLIVTRDTLKELYALDMANNVSHTVMIVPYY
jgi:hypothetical protein